MVRWLWKDSRGPIKWSDLSDKTREYYRTSTFTMEYGSYPEDWDYHKLDYDHPDGPYKFVKESACEKKEGFHSYFYELDEGLRDQLEYPAIKHHAELRVPNDWTDKEKLKAIIEGRDKRGEILKVPEVKKCPKCKQTLPI